MENEENLKKLETLLDAVQRGVSEAKAGRFQEADRILNELRHEYEKERFEDAIKKTA